MLVIFFFFFDNSVNHDQLLSRQGMYLIFVDVLFSFATHLNDVEDMSSVSRLSEPLVLDGVVVTVI